MKARLAEKRSSFSLDWICLSQETQKTCRGSSSFTPCAGENYKAGKLQLMRIFLGHSLLVLERRYALFIPRIWLKVAENKTGFVSWEEQIFLSKLPGPGPSLGRISAIRPVGSAPGTGLGPCPWDAFSSADGLICVCQFLILSPISLGHRFSASSTNALLFLLRHCLSNVLCAESYTLPRKALCMSKKRMNRG